MRLVLVQSQCQASPVGGQPEEKTVLSVWDLKLCQSPPSPQCTVPSAV